jgi:tellurium resistance protein TerZ
MSISLEKGQKINLEKEAGGSLSKIFVGCGWDVASGIFGIGGGSVDLDLSAILFDEQKNPLETIYFGHLRAHDNSVYHSGDNLTGDGDGDDEVVSVDVPKLAPNVASIVFTINSYRGQTFDKVKNAFCRVVNASGNKELVKYDLGAKGAHTAMVMSRLYKHGGEWKFQAIGETGQGRTAHDLVNFAKTTF